MVPASLHIRSSSKTTLLARVSYGMDEKVTWFVTSHEMGSCFWHSYSSARSSRSVEKELLHTIVPLFLLFLSYIENRGAVPASLQVRSSSKATLLIHVSYGMNEKVTWFFTSHEMGNGFWHGTRILWQDHLDMWRGNYCIPAYLYFSYFSHTLRTEGRSRFTSH